MNLSESNLSEQHRFNILGNVHYVFDNLIDLNLEMAGLQTQNLIDLTEAISSQVMPLKFLNLSYNTL